MRASRYLAAVAAAAIVVAIPALAQVAAPAGNTAAPTPAPAPTAIPTPTQQAPSAAPDSVGESDTGVVELTAPQANQPPAPPVEYPAHARRDPRLVGRLDPVDLGL